jgi:cytochrome c
MSRVSLRTIPSTLAVVLVLTLLVSACGGAPTPTATKAPQPVAGTTPAAAAPAGAVSFSKDILPLFQKNCTRCHGGSSPRQGLSLDSYAAVMKGSSGGAVVVAGNPDKSALYSLVKSGAMPFGGSKLADADIQKISDWITAGAPNN